CSRSRRWARASRSAQPLTESTHENHSRKSLTESTHEDRPRRSPREITYAELLEILRIISSSDLNEVTIESADVRIYISKRLDGRGPSVETTAVPGSRAAAPPAIGPSVAPVAGAVPGAAVAQPGAAPQPAAPEPPPGAVVVSAPMLGTFYRAPAPDQPPYVEVGQRVAAGDTLCLIEAMKLFTPLTAPCAGVVGAILAENARLVEYGQPLMYVEPDEAT
ncbi:MAG: acetyl-CoA carboxylase biotin carboxyl carrier protein, partial [Chloroflexi bacterium]|nr:acetyl-CoA carboxylase biotin carboxyl carrier protein [Chloroflexota bacterium]